MKNKRFMRKTGILLCAAGLVSLMQPQVQAAELEVQTEQALGEVRAGAEAQAEGEVSVVIENSYPLTPKGIIEFEASEIGMTSNLMYRYSNTSARDVVLTAKSSNPKVIELSGETSCVLKKSPYGFYGSQNFVVKGKGAAVITFTVEGRQYSQKYHVKPEPVDVKEITQTAYNALRVSWDRQEGVDGYQVVRAPIGSDEQTVVQTVLGADQTSAAVPVTDWDQWYSYRVQAFCMDGEEKVLSYVWGGSPMDFAAVKSGTEIISADKAGTDSVKVTWKKVNEAVGYKVYRSMQENGRYSCVADLKSAATSFTQKVKKGIAYYYRVETIYPNTKSGMSNTFSCILPKKSAPKAMVVKSVSQSVTTRSYSWNWSHVDPNAYYVKGGKLHLVCLRRGSRNKKLMIYTMKPNGKVASKKKIPLSGEIWGGFYQGPDGNFYVAEGYGNTKESKTKTVIKVTQYSGNWKKKKTAAIKGSAGNVFTGIYMPFDAGNCRMTMQGNTLYLHMARKMFAASDGLNHQSNIAFAVDTRTMSAKVDNHTYVSHSFNQFAVFKDGNLYLADHGDAYPRSLVLEMVNDYGKKTMNGRSVKMFNLAGQIGDNFTGCTMGGMEVGKKNVMVCGTSQPHLYKIKGVKGMHSLYRENAYLITTNRETGKVKVIWLTNYHPKKNRIYVDETRMVKLTDDRFAVLYCTWDKKNRSTLHYVVVDNEGKKIYSKSYKNFVLKGGSQPILYDGKIVWTETDFAMYTNKSVTKLYQIPAVW